MINTLKIYEELAQTMEDAAARRLASVLGLIYEDLQNTVTKVEFNELRGTVRELAEAQQRTEQRMAELAEAQQRTEQRVDVLGIRMAELAEAQQRTEQRVAELAEAQQRTEQRVDVLGIRMAELAEAQQRTEQRVDVLGIRMAELAEAQQRTEQRVDVLGIRMAELAQAQQRTEQRMEELAEAQQRTEQRMEELAEAQQRTEQRMEELAEAQKQTTQILASLSRAHDNTRQQVGGLSRTMAYALENEAYRLLPAFLKTQHQLEVCERLIRAWVNGEEINFYARARRDGEEVVIVGESVMRLDDGAKFGQLQRQLEAVRAVEALPLVPLLVTHFARPDLLEQARQQGIVVVQSFEWG